MALPNDVLPLGPAANPGDWLADDILDPPAAALQPGVGHRLHAVARLIRRRFERMVRQAGLPITRLQAALLVRIARNPALSQTAAATDLDIEPIALVRMLDRLAEEGLVERRAHPTDRRVRTLWLTPLGRRVVDRILGINMVVREEACAGLSPKTRDMLMDTLDHMKNNLAAAEAAAGDPVEPVRVAE
ncbi:MAG TPA: MarR family transcriptional regulator [Stellaceae bacterium]|jgi:DNA-binding MarR family transcriptional regulator|nr:MarR family transcriptional regulator [Stellaceae bacterium]